ncbi:MAG: sigma-70 family RNA polymerase sigma factor [Planctomycetota bacterium]|nr:sigma-70 family RNA polymerase sigma factor [Planctomycetota bacterium]
MNLRNKYDGIEQDAVLLIRSKATQLVGQHGFTASDREDIEQELMLDLFQHLPRFNPKRARRKTFINRVVCHTVVRLIRRQDAGRRDHRRNDNSLNEDARLPDGQTTGGANTLNEEANQPGCTDLAGDLLVLDVQAVIALLPEYLRDMAVRLRTQTAAQAAREMGVARSTVYKRILELRQFFGKAGLRDYLCQLSDT